MQVLKIPLFIDEYPFRVEMPNKENFTHSLFFLSLFIYFEAGRGGGRQGRGETQAIYKIAVWSSNPQTVR